jgi:sugar lactone lactonase YvrE
VRRWGWLHVRALVEEHAGGRCLLRVETRMGPSVFGAVQTLMLAVLLAGVTSAAIALRFPAVSAATVAVAIVMLLRAVSQTIRTAALLDRAIDRATTAEGFVPVTSRVPSTRPSIRLLPSTPAQRAQAVLVLTVLVSAGFGGMSVARDAAARQALAAQQDAAGPRDASIDALSAPSGGVTVDATGYVLVADAQAGLISRFRPQTALDALRASDRFGGGRRTVGVPVPFEGAADIVLALDGDYFVSDSRNHRIYRIDRPTGRTTTIAGSGTGGFDGDDKQAAQAALNGPSGLAMARNGDLYIADTLNHRVRLVEQATGLIRTIAGTGAPGGAAHLVGDGGPAIEASLYNPSGVALAPNGDLYIADTGHNRIRRVARDTGIITTVAGDGLAGALGDGGPAALARLAAPMGLAVVPSGRAVTIYVADSLNGRVRVIDTAGAISTLGSQMRFVMPSRLTHHPSGWLYVKDASTSGVTAVSLTRSAQLDFAATPRRPASRKVT